MPTLMGLGSLSYPGGQRDQTTLATLEDADLPHAELAEKLQRLLIAKADLLRQVGIGGESEGSAGLDAHLGKGARGIDLANRLAQPGGRDLDRDPAGRDRV